MSSGTGHGNASPSTRVRSRLLYLAIVAGAATLPNPARAAIEVSFEDDPEPTAPSPTSPAAQPTGKLSFALEPGENGARALVLTSEAGMRLLLADIEARWACAISEHFDSDDSRQVHVSCGDGAVTATLIGPATARIRAHHPDEDSDIEADVYVRGEEVRTFHFDLAADADAQFGTGLPDPSAQCDPTGDRVVDIDVSEWSIPHGHGKHELSRVIRVVSQRLGIDEKIEAADDLACSADQEDSDGVKVVCWSKTEPYKRFIDVRIADGGASVSSGPVFICSGGPSARGMFRLPCGAQVRVRGWRNIW